MIEEEEEDDEYANSYDEGDFDMLNDPRSRGAESYRELAEELLIRNDVESPRARERKVEAAARGKPADLEAEVEGLRSKSST